MKYAIAAAAAAAALPLAKSPPPALQPPPPPLLLQQLPLLGPRPPLRPLLSDCCSSALAWGAGVGTGS